MNLNSFGHGNYDMKNYDMGIMTWKIMEGNSCTFLEYASVEYISLYWIYPANTWGMGVSWRVSVCPSGTGLGECTFLNYVTVEYIS